MSESLRKAARMPRKSASGTVTLHTGKGAKVKFGNVTVVAAKPAKPSVEGSVTLSQEALKRAAPRLKRAGVSIGRRKNVPLYHIDGDDPNVIIRRLNGSIERGTFVDGQFQKLP